MTEHIDRDAFLTQERAWYCNNCDRRKNSKGKTVYEIGEAPCRACYVENILDDVENCPAADVVERKTGRWIIKDYPGTGWYRVTCSACGEDVTSTAPVIGFFPNAIITWNYCPECGSYNGGDGDV